MLFPVIKYFPHIVGSQTGRITITMPVVFELFSIEAVETAKVCPYPENILMVDAHAFNYVIAQAVFIVWIVQVLFKCIFLPVKKNQSAAIGANPEITGFIFNKPVDIVVWKAHYI